MPERSKENKIKTEVPDGADHTPQELTAGKKMVVDRYFATEGVHPFDEIEWALREASITDDQGGIIFEQKEVEAPVFWSQLATKIVVSKYFYGGLPGDEREHSVRQLIHRVTRSIADRGWADGYFDSKEDVEHFYHDLTWLCVHQYGSFNSPVWFNVGLKDTYGVEGSPNNFRWDESVQRAVPCKDSYSYPQASACFIQSVEDSMQDIMRLAQSEAMLFKHGSGTGTDLSTLRSSRERMSGGGTPSGPVSFMRVFDQVAGVIKSGGKTRRAAKMQSLHVSHPDIKEFITCKADEEKKAWALIEQGYDGDFNGTAYGSVMFQNANLSVRVTDDFMRQEEQDGEWKTIAVSTQEELESFRARELMELIAEGTHICGDPGMQYHSTINAWNTCANTAPIQASNPCSEFMFINNSACNLASLNLMKFRQEDGSFDITGFKKAVRLFIIAQDILVDNGSYPEKRITENSHNFRPLGLGYANLGCLAMSLALPYESAEAHELAAGITALLTGTAYGVSSELAQVKGVFAGYAQNEEPMLKVMQLHREAAQKLGKQAGSAALVAAARAAWEQACAAGAQYGFRNAQVSLLAPTGTIGFMMDCDTTGIEPDIALVKYKLLAGGGMLKMVNQTIPMALERLGYSAEDRGKICAAVERDDTIETAAELRPADLPVFDCAFQPVNGSRHIHWKGHVNMMAAVQPFLSGAISKTINMPHDCTVEDIANVYRMGWKVGLKAVAIYRDGSKRTQPVNTGTKQIAEAPSVVPQPYRRRLPDTRSSVTHKFSVGGHEGYLTVGLYDDGTPGELFVTMAKEGSTVGGMMDAFGTCISMALQYGVPLETLVGKFRHARFEPAGMTTNRDMPFAKSLIDYIACWMGCRFIAGYAAKNTPNRSPAPMQEKAAEKAPASQPVIAQFNSQFEHFQADAPVCDVCGSLCVRNGTCYRCYNCGNSLGCS